MKGNPSLKDKGYKDRDNTAAEEFLNFNFWTRLCNFMTTLFSASGQRRGDINTDEETITTVLEKIPQNVPL